MEQATLNSIADKLDVFYEVIDNLSDGKKTYRAQITLTNHSSHSLAQGDWAIFFCQMRMIEPDVLPQKDSVLIAESQVTFSHINGCLYKLQPAGNFRTLEKGSSLKITFNAQSCCIAKTDIFPNWYMTAEGCEPALIQSTVDETLSFVSDFNSNLQWKRFDYAIPTGRMVDLYNPYSPEERYQKNARANISTIPKMVIPTPVHLTHDKDKHIVISSVDWLICADHKLIGEAKYLAGNVPLVYAKTSLGIETAAPISDNPEKHCIKLCLCAASTILEKTTLTDVRSEELYELTVDCDNESILIRGSDTAGVFYGVQTLLRVFSSDNTVTGIHVIDSPRFPYRGMHIDVARNFHAVTQMKLVLEVMAMYKMNKLHFHLSDDEGWRIEIPGLEELTQVGGKRGHDLTETTCILPVLGSGPMVQSLFYSVKEFRSLLTYAKHRHIEIIPEIDMPGHSHAAIKTMQLRFERQIATGDKCDDFRLVGERTGKVHHSVQKYVNNAIDPGIESTFDFIDKVITELVKMYEDISPLRVFHFGGDEVPMDSWLDYKACVELIKSGKVKEEDDLMPYFVNRVSKVTADHGLNLGAWQDAVIDDDNRRMMSRDELVNKDVIVYAWYGKWEYDSIDSGNRLANNGYKVVMAQGSHLYFDHPYEPDPEERGLYWATRYIDTFKTFQFMPLNLLGNFEEKYSGEPISEEDLVEAGKTFEQLRKPENVIGIQGQLWSETVRSPQQLHQLVFPRLLALAERAWHKAPWEDIETRKSRDEAILQDWSEFASALGKHDLLILDKKGVAYHIPPPGARLVDDCKLETNTAYPGLTVEMSVDGGKSWSSAVDGTEIYQSAVHLRTRSADGQRRSRTIVLNSAT